MPIIRSAKKAHEASLRKQVFNVRRKRTMKDAVKDVRSHVSAGKLKEAQEGLTTAYKAIDKAAKRGVIKKNTADRKKSRLAKFVSQASVKK